MSKKKYILMSKKKYVLMFLCLKRKICSYVLMSKKTC